MTLFLAGCAAAASPLATATPQAASGPDRTSEALPTPTPLATPTPQTEQPESTPTPGAEVPQSTPAPSDATEVASRPRIQVPAVIPRVDLSRHSVPLDQIYFDTFLPVDRVVPLSEARSKLINELRDAIPPIHNPKYDPVSRAGWLNGADLVIGYAAGGQAWAYPIRILNFHEIVNDTLAGEPILISYCPLCASGIVFSRKLGDQVLTFGNTSALYESDMVMLDYQTGSYWWQVAGEAIVGTLTGEELEVLPSLVTPWSQWRELYPETLVLSRDTGRSLQTYDRDPFLGYEDFVNSGRNAFPVSPAAADPRLLPGSRVLAVKVGDEVLGYPLSDGATQAIVDQVGAETILVLVSEDASGGAAFRPWADGRSLTFGVQEGRIMDRETGSTWNLAGRAIGGELAGAQLPALPSRTSYWFAIVAAEPEIVLYQFPEGK